MQEQKQTKQQEQQHGDFESHGLKKLALKVIEGIIVEEQLSDKDIQDERRTICFSCELMDHKNIMCKSCGCFLELKTKSKVNKTIDGLSEITHCPENYWLDEFSKLGYKLKKENDTK